MRQNSLIVIIAVVFAAFTLVGRLGGVAVDWLWFDSVGYLDVYTTRLVAQVVLFAISALAFLAVFIGNGLLALRLASRNEPPPVVIPWEQRSREHGLLTIAMLGFGVALALLVGLGTAGSWGVVLRYMNPTQFGVTDPLFGQEVSFFVFTLPLFSLLQSWFTGTLMLTLLACVAIYGVKIVLPRLRNVEQGDIDTIRRSIDVGMSGKMHLSILLALIVVGLAARSWLDIYGLVYAPGGLFFGAGFADVNARMPALWLMVGLTLAVAVLILVSTRQSGYRLLAIGIGLWFGLSVIAVDLYPSIIQRVEVLPSEYTKEQPYLEHNINMTNKAYALDRITEVEYDAQETITAAEVAANPGTINNIRLWDPQPLLDTYNQIQSIRLYYEYLDIDVDRYMINGQYRQVMLGARELIPSKLASQAQTWVNIHLQYTHGYGAAMSPVNEVTPEGLPTFFLRDVPPQGAVPITRPEIYFGEGTNQYVIVRTEMMEFDYPRGDDNVFVRYEGEAGVEVGSMLRRALFAWQFGDVNIVLSNALTSESKILYHRNIRERVEKVAPFLAYDRDPYVVVADERLYWIQDAYTITDRYPYSTPVQAGASYNYMRNSVKVVVDAYEGNMQFFMADPSDPIINTYSDIFPGLFVPMEEMPESLRAHVRYPEGLFSVQADLYRRYHMRDPLTFYNSEDLWNVPTEIYIDKVVNMQPYYVIMRLPGEEREEFVLILPYTPPNRNNMITWLAARSDGEHYGNLVAYRYPKERLIFGPMQIEARIDQDTTISEQLTLWNQAGSRVLRGNLIVIPIGNSNLYVEPIYLQSDQSRLPEMKRVIVASGNRVIMAETANQGLALLIGGGASVPPVVEVPPQNGQPPPTTGPVGEAARQLLERYSRLQEDMSAIQADLRRLIEELEGAQSPQPPQAQQ